MTSEHALLDRAAQPHEPPAYTEVFNPHFPPPHAFDPSACAPQSLTSLLATADAAKLVDTSAPLLTTVQYINWLPSWRSRHATRTASSSKHVRAEFEGGVEGMEPPAYDRVPAPPGISLESPTQFEDMIGHFLNAIIEGNEASGDLPALPTAAAEQNGASGAGGGVLMRQNCPYQGSRTQVIPRGLEHKDRISVIAYQSCVKDFLPTAALPERRFNSQGKGPHVKLGGVWMELGSRMIAALVEKVTAVKVAHVDMFLVNQGRCSLFLENPDDAPLVLSTLNRRMWLGPPGAVFANSSTAADRLQGYVQRLRDKSRSEHHHWPRHLLTAERWFPKSEFRKQAHVRNGPSIQGERAAFARPTMQPRDTSPIGSAPESESTTTSSSASSII